MHFRPQPLATHAWRIRRVVTASAIAFALASSSLAAQSAARPMAQAAGERLDTLAIARIKDEGTNRSQVMETMSWLTDVYGPRLTNSPNYRAAGNWAVKTLQSYGLVNARLEPWGPFGRGWSNERFTLQALTPQAYPIFAYPQAWSVGTKGPARGEVVMAMIDSAPDLEKYRGKLRGKFVMTAPAREVRPSFTALGSRYTDEELTALSQPEPERPAGGRGGGGRGNFAGAAEFNRQRQQFYVDEGVLALLSPGRGDGGTIFVSGGGSREPNAPPDVPKVTLAVEHYGRIARTVAKGLPVTLELNAENKFYDADLNSFNVVAEIPGSDPKLKDEVVMLGGHFDSWHTGTGATDNAAGSAVMMEALRIIKAAGLKSRRTIRIALWGGEEQGLLGSRAYVAQHFAERPAAVPGAAGQPGGAGAGGGRGGPGGAPAGPLTLKPEHAKFAGYFNVDNGTGKIRGVYLQGNQAVAPIFQAWMEPFRGVGMTTLTPRNTGGTDHLAFDGVGLPGFQFIQDEVEYSSRTHHSNMDVYERVQSDDMKHNSVVVATFVYQAANRDEKLPRKPMARPTPPRT